jgi:DNA-3-methyladenine glycosylase
VRAEGAPARMAALPPSRLAAGPGLLAAAFDITREDTGSDLFDPEASLRLEAGTSPPRIATTARVGIGYAPEPWRTKPWRFVDPDSPSVSVRVRE